MKFKKVKLEETDKENTFLRDEVKDLTVLLSAKVQTSSHCFKTISERSLLRFGFGFIHMLRRFRKSVISLIY